MKIRPYFNIFTIDSRDQLPRDGSLVMVMAYNMTTGEFITASGVWDERFADTFRRTYDTNVVVCWAYVKKILRLQRTKK